MPMLHVARHAVQGANWPTPVPPPPPGGGGGGGGSNPDYGPDLRDWIKQPTTVGSPANLNGGILYLPPREYYGGAVDKTNGSQHAFDGALPNNGWLRLVPQNVPTLDSNYRLVTDVTYNGSLTAGGATLGDQSKGGGLHFGTNNDSNGVGDFRVSIEGVKFNNCPMFNGFGARKLKFIYCEATYPPATWASDYDAVASANGRSPGYPRNDNYVRDRMKANYSDNGFNARHNFAPFRCEDICILGCDFHNFMDDYINMVGARKCRIHGTRGWNQYGAGTYADDHGDCFQLEGGEYDIYMDYVTMLAHFELIQSYEEGSLGVSGTPGSGGQWGLRVHHCWMMGAPQPISLGAAGTDINGNPVTNNNRPYNCGFAQGGGYLPDLGGVTGDYFKYCSVDWVDYGAGGGPAEYIFPDQPGQPWTAQWPRTYINEVPAGITLDGAGRLPGYPNTLTTAAHAKSPGVLWKVNWPYSVAGMKTYIDTYAAADGASGASGSLGWI